MKRIIILLFCAWFVQSCCTPNKFAMQKDFGALLALGLTGVKDGDSWEPKAGGLIGVETKVLSCNEFSSFYAGIILLFQGAANTEIYDIGNLYDASLKSAQLNENEFSGKVALSYIDFPLLYNYQSEGGFYGEIGLQPGFLISAKEKYDGGSSDFNDQVKSFDLGLPIGVGYRINEQLSAGVRATYGLTNFNKLDDGDNDHNYSILGVLRYNFGSLLENKN